MALKVSDVDNKTEQKGTDINNNFNINDKSLSIIETFSKIIMTTKINIVDNRESLNCCFI